MKGTAIGLVVLSVYWILQGIEIVRQTNNMNGFVNIILGLALLPLAKYVWNKNLGGTPK
jgi:hypothetical protein